MNKIKNKNKRLKKLTKNIKENKIIKEFFLVKIMFSMFNFLKKRDY